MRRLGLILLYFVILAALFARNIPLFEASDEAEHFIYIHQILETGVLPVIQSREMMANREEPILRWNNQSHHAPLYYLSAAGIIAWSERADLADYLAPNELIFLRNTVEDNPNKWLHRYTEPTSDSHLAVYVLRAVNILIGVGTLYMVYYAAKQLNEGETLALLSAFFVASLPTFVAVNASVSNDALVIFLYSAGIAWILRVWRLQEIKRVDILLISLILAGISLTKLTGVSLFGLIFFGLLLGLLRGRFDLARVIQTMLASLLITALLAGWWYFRNYQIYGDPLALEATASIWGREIPFNLEMLPAELLRIGKSFWMMVGYLHFPVFAPDWFYWLMLAMTILGFAGLALYSWKKTRMEIGLLLFACLLVVGMLLYGTRSVDISYGRLLLPAIAAFAPLMVLGWQSILRRFSPIAVLPLVGMAFYVPLILLPQAYPSLSIAENFPANAIPVNWKSENLEIVALAIREEALEPHQVMTVDLYFRGSHPDNPALIITAVDSIRTARLEHMEIYPAMADMRYLPDAHVYHLPIRMELARPDAALSPRMVYLNLEWVNLEDDSPIVFDSGLSRLEIPAVAFSDPAYDAPNLHPIEASFSEIVLASYSIESGTLQFVWRPLKLSTDWTLTVQVFDSEGNFVTQSDGALWWYPSSRWIENLAFEDVRSLPANLDRGEYTLRIGWYREENGQFIRMPVTLGESVDNLLILPETLVIE